MNINLFNAFKKIIDQYGAAVLDDSKRFNGLLADFAVKEPKAQRIALFRCVMNGYHKELQKAPEPQRVFCKQRLAQKLHDDEGLDSALCSDTIDLLAAALFGESPPAPQSAPQPAPVTPPSAPRPQPVPQPQPVPFIPPAASPQTQTAQKHTLRNILIAAAAVIAVCIIWNQLSNTAQSSNTNPTAQTANANPVSKEIEGASYSGTMTQGSSSLSIRLILGGIINDEAVNTNYMYTKYNTPISLRGGMYEGALVLQEVTTKEVETKKEAIFVFEDFNISRRTITGIWFNSHDDTDIYQVTLTKE